jgi:hypothetical protein
MHHRLGLAALLAALASMTPASASAATDLGAFWHLDESSGTTAVDTSGNANHGTINGASRTTGRFGRALRFDGNDDSVFIARSGNSLEPAAVTVESWVRGSASPGAFKHIISQGAYLCEVASYGLYTGAGGGAAFYVSNGSDDQVAVSPQAPPSIWDGAWHHVAGTYDGTAVRLFVDGAEVGTGTAATIPIGYGLPNPAGQLGAFGGGCMLNWAGDLDEPRIWRRALSASELAASAAMGNPTTTTLDEKLDASEAIVYTSAFDGKSIKISLESSNAGERIRDVRIRSLLGLFGGVGCGGGLLLSSCDIALSNGGRTAQVTVTRDATLRVTLGSGRSFDVEVNT